MHNLTKRVKKIVRKSAVNLMFLDKTKEKAHYHKGMMDAHLSKACELTTVIADQMWAETDSEHSDSR